MNERQLKIQKVLNDHDLCHGVGNEETMCSIAAINYAISGRVTDDIPDCASPVICRWVIGVQDSMPLEQINSMEWKSLLPLIAGTGREHERERFNLIIDWMWDTLSIITPTCDDLGFGEAWREMLTLKTPAAAARADAAAARAAVRAAAAADAAARAAARAAAAAARAAARAAAAADAAAAAAAADAAARAAAARVKFWKDSKPETLLKQLIEVQESDGTG